MQQGKAEQQRTNKLLLNHKTELVHKHKHQHYSLHYKYLLSDHYTTTTDLQLRNRNDKTNGNNRITDPKKLGHDKNNNCLNTWSASQESNLNTPEEGPRWTTTQLLVCM